VLQVPATGRQSLLLPHEALPLWQVPWVQPSSLVQDLEEDRRQLPEALPPRQF
jgi:hypothetical protein